MDACPGWTIEKLGGYDVSWSTNYNWSGAWLSTDNVPADCTLTNWAQGYNISQTIEDLPAGIYTLASGLVERSGQDDVPDAESYLWARTSDISEDDDPLRADVEVFGNQDWNAKRTTVLEGIEVTDGILTIGVSTNGASHLFLNDFELLLTEAAAFEYDKAYQEYLTAIDETVARPAKVRAFELYDLNGRRINSARQGVVIQKKYMSDGTVRTEKIVKK